MSRLYGMRVQIKDYNKNKLDAIEDACESEWGFSEFDTVKDYIDKKDKLEAYFENTLCGGESEDEFVDRLSIAIWKANDKFCTVEVYATYLEELPCEFHTREKEDYEKLMGNKTDNE